MLGESRSRGELSRGRGCRDASRGTSAPSTDRASRQTAEHHSHSCPATSQRKIPPFGGSPKLGRQTPCPAFLPGCSPPCQLPPLSRSPGNIKFFGLFCCLKTDNFAKTAVSSCKIAPLPGSRHPSWSDKHCLEAAGSHQHRDNTSSPQNQSSVTAVAILPETWRALPSTAQFGARPPATKPHLPAQKWRQRKALRPARRPRPAG